MKMDKNQLIALITSQQEPEPFSGVVQINKGNELLFAESFGFAQLPNR
jgi:hypothetical protein